MVTLVDGIDGTWTNGTEFDAGEMRRADAAMFSSGGVARGLDVTVTASDEVRVAAGSWVIDGDETSLGAGVYRGGIASQASASLEARDATYGRIDLVVARQYDADVVGSHTGYQAAVEVLTGTPSANPSAPALPDLAVELAKLEVPADGGGAVAVDSSGRRYAAARAVRPFLYVWHSGTTRSSGQDTVVSWDGLEEASGGAAISRYFLTFGPAGVYQVSAAALANTSSTGGYSQIFLRDYDTGAAIARGTAHRVGGYITLSFAIAVRVSEGQRFYVTLASSGGSTNFPGSRDRLYLTSVRVGD